MDKIKVSMPINKMFTNLESKDGKKYDSPRISVLTSEDLVNDKTFSGRVSCFDKFNRTSEWREGMTVEVYLEKKVVGENVYWNIVFPSKTDFLEERVAKLEEAVFKEQPQTDVPF